MLYTCDEYEKIKIEEYDKNIVYIRFFDMNDNFIGQCGYFESITDARKHLEKIRPTAKPIEITEC